MYIVQCIVYNVHCRCTCEILHTIYSLSALSLTEIRCPPPPAGVPIAQLPPGGTTSRLTNIIVIIVLITLTVMKKRDITYLLIG